MTAMKFLCALFTVFLLASLPATAGAEDVWHYRMTVTIETPEDDKTGSAVREVTGAPNLKITPESCGYCVGLSKGEAVVIDLGKRGVVFSLLSNGEYDLDYAHKVFLQNFPDGKGSGIARLKPENYPTFVRFKDPANPKSIDVVAKVDCTNDPCKLDDNFEEAFGKGVFIKSVHIETTTAPVTSEVEKYLPSYKPYSAYQTWLNSLKYRDPRRIGYESFKRSPD